MDHDFGTPDAMATVFETVRRANGALDGGEEADQATSLALTAIELANVVGLQVALDASGAESGDDAAIQEMVDARSAAKVAKNFAEADRLRDELTSMGITVEDTANGPIFYRS